MTLFAHIIRVMLAAIVAAGFLAIPSSASAKTRPTLHFGSSGSTVVSLQKRLKIPHDGVFGKQTLGRVLRLQARKGLRPDGIVGPRTWRFVLNPGKRPIGKPFTATGHRRAVLDKKNNVVFLVRSNGSVARRFWTVDNDNVTPTGHLSQKGRINPSYNLTEQNKRGDLTLYYFVTIHMARGIGFHAIPRRPNGQEIHSANELGAGTGQRSHGCVRLGYSAAKYLYGWLPRGASVRVVSSL